MKQYIIILGIILSPFANASFPEFFGSYPTTSGIGNQANSDAGDPANNYYIPALSAWSKTIGISAIASNVSSNFEPISNITTKNSTNSTTDETGGASTDYQNFLGSGLNVILPIRYKGAGALGLSYFSPVGKIVESHSGDAELPEYVMYRSRYRRTQLFLSYAHPLSEEWAFSLGTHIGFQAGAHVNTQVSLGDNFGSSGTAKSDVRPSLGALFSLAKKGKDSLTYFSYQQEMKSKLEATTFGEITDPPLTLINIGINSMIFYDPHIFRLGHTTNLTDSLEAFMALEYQLWSGYKTPTIVIINKGGSVRSSNGFENVQTKNILVPKLGMKYKWNDSISLMSGASYRQTPIQGNFSGNGNSLDTDTFIVSAGSSLDFKFFDHDIQLSGSAQYHMLKEVKVSKAPGEENGSSGSKIGAPGYTIGGEVITVVGGVKVLF